MKLENPIVHLTDNPPSSFLEQLKEETIPFESIFNLKNPLDGYAKGMKESFVGDKTILARITGNEARLMPFGQWPVKGKSPTANAGYLRCQVHPSNTGSSIDARYVFPIVYKIAIPLFVVFGVLLVIAIVLLGLFGANVDGRFELMAAAGFGCFVMTAISLGILMGAKKQAKLTHEFLADFVAKQSMSRED